MQLSKKAIEEFKEIYERKEGKKISDKEATELALNLMSAFEAIYRPILREEINKLNQTYGFKKK